MKAERISTIKLSMTESEAQKVRMMLDEVSSNSHDIPEWAYKTSLELIGALESVGIEQ